LRNNFKKIEKAALNIDARLEIAIAEESGRKLPGPKMRDALKVYPQTDRQDGENGPKCPPAQSARCSPPITPHFSSTAAFVFPSIRKTPTKLQSPPPDEIF